MQEKNKKRKKRKNEKRKVGSKAQKQATKSYSRRLHSNNLPVSATKPRRGPCHTICHLLPALVCNGIKCRCCRCRASPPANKSTKTKQNCLDSGAVATQVPLISRDGTLPHDLPGAYYFEVLMLKSRAAITESLVGPCVLYTSGVQNLDLSRNLWFIGLSLALALTANYLQCLPYCILLVGRCSTSGGKTILSGAVP